MSAEPSKNLEIAGGQGELVKSRSDVKLVERAIRNEWPIPEETRERLIEEMFEIVSDENARVRMRIGAARAILVADSINVRREAMLVRTLNSHIRTRQVEGKEIRVEKCDNWYGNADHIAAAKEPRERRQTS